jgi:diaminopimelate epimerase
MTEIVFAKGHGTGNDFVLLPDDAGTLDLTEERVRRLSDRHHGIGADGVIRVTKAANVEGATTRDLWFMDYRNADGSIAEMCGNGIRVFVEYLRSSGRVEGDSIDVETRAGVLTVATDPDGYRVAMGKALDVAGDITVETENGKWNATGVAMPNPHAVVPVRDIAAVGALRQAPEVLPPTVFPHGVNVEFIKVIGLRHLQLRVFERGVGETLSCGTGVCAAAYAARQKSGETGFTRWQVDVPGGTLFVEQDDDQQITLVGPAEIVATGHISAQLWN